MVGAGEVSPRPGAVAPDAFSELDHSTWERAVQARCPQRLLSFKTNLQEKWSEAEGCSEGVSETLGLLNALSRATWSALALAGFSLNPWVHHPAGGRTLGVETRGWKGRARAQPHMAAPSTHTENCTGPSALSIEAGGL